jgi:hypothetical protein
MYVSLLVGRYCIPPSSLDDSIAWNMELKDKNIPMVYRMMSFPPMPNGGSPVYSICGAVKSSSLHSFLGKGFQINQTSKQQNNIR